MKGTKYTENKGKKTRQKLTTFLLIAQCLSMQFRPFQQNFHNFYSFKLLYIVVKCMANSQTNKTHILKPTKCAVKGLRYARIKEATRTN
jgi:hypothetical protein